MCELRAGIITANKASNDKILGLAVCYCLARGFNRQGLDLDTIPADSAEDCQIKCRKYPGCHFFVYHIGYKMCWVKSEEPANYLAREEIIAGPDYC